MQQMWSKWHQEIGAIFKDMQTALYKYAFSIVQNSTDAEDVLQTSIMKFIGAYDKICELPEAALRGYLKKIVRNESMNIMRARRKDIDIDEYPVADEKNDVANSVIKRLEYEEALKIVHELKPKHAMYINMKYFQDAPDERIALVLGMKTDSLRMLASRARAELIEKINKKGGEK